MSHSTWIPPYNPTEKMKDSAYISYNTYVKIPYVTVTHIKTFHLNGLTHWKYCID